LGAALHAVQPAARIAAMRAGHARRKRGKAGTKGSSETVVPRTVVL